jgi:branched-chain amino acid transport system ATP-binding protein
MSLLSLQNVSHNFTGLRAVDSFSLELAPEELVGLIGPNGAGKTTIFNLITGVYRPTEGRIFLRDQEITGRRPSHLVGLGLARTFQNIRLFRGLSVLDNVRIAHYARTRYGLASGLLRLPRFHRAEQRLCERSLELLDLFGLADLAPVLAGGLPYGQQRRLEITRALATDPTLLLLDEPAAGMNPTEADALLELILRLHGEFRLTILLIEHQMRVMMGSAQRIVVLDFGKTIAEGTPAEIRTNRRVIEAYLGEEEG